MRTAAGATVEGPAGSATEVVMVEHEPDDRADWQGNVCTWLLRCPGQSPAWEQYMLSVIHLRPIDGVRPAVVSEPGATHELMLFAMDPSEGPARPDDMHTWALLRPINVCEQLVLPDDAAARQLALDVVRAVVAGRLWAEPPLAGQVEPWRATLRATAAHLRGEHDG